MFEEFNHFFKEEYFDLSVDGIVLEAYSKKEENRIKKFLKENKFEEDPNATTAEEKRKGYRRGTIETDIPDNKGGKKRVNFEITPHDADPGLTFKNEDKFASITMSKRTLARKPAVSNFIFKHEEGHAAVHLDESGKYVMEMEKVDKILTRLLHKMLTNKADALNEHDSNIEEFIADKYAKEHAKHQKTSTYNLKDSYGNEKIDISTKNALVGLQTLLSDDRFTKRCNKEAVNFYKQMEIDRRLGLYSKEQLGNIKRRMELCKDALSRQIKYFSLNVELLNSHDKLLKHAKDTLEKDEKTLENNNNKVNADIKQVYDLLKYYAEDLNNELIIARENGKVLSKFERRNKVDEMYRKVRLSTDNSQAFKYVAGKNKEDDSEVKSSLNFYKKQVISGKHYVEFLKNSIDEINDQIKEITNKKNELKSEYKKLEKEYIDFTEAISDKNKMKALDAYEKFAKYAETTAKSKVYGPTVTDDMSTLVRILMLLPKEDRDRFAKEVHDTTIEVAKLEKAAEDRKELTTESYVDDNDDTSGTSDFNRSDDNDPDDCYCESVNDSFLNEYTEYISEMVDNFLQDSFDIIQEGSHKTNTRRKIHKLEHEAKKHDIDLKIDKYHNTSASVERDRSSDGVSKSTVYVNPRDIYSTKSKDVKNIFNHEKNHVLIDKRKHRDVDGYNRSAIIYKGDKDVDDIKLIKAFINSHRKMIKTPHSADIDEYIADLNSARETSFESMINTLTELYLPEDKKNLKGLKKYHYEDLKNQIIINHDNMSKSPKDITHRIDHPSKETYETNKRRFNSVIDKDPRGFIAKDSVDLKNKLTQFKKIYETYESYVNYVRSHDVDIDSVITSYIDAYNSDLDMRIAFLKYAKDIFSPRSKPSPDQIKEYCVNDPLNELMQQQGIAVDDTSRKSNGTWIDVIQEFSNCLRSKLDMAKYSEESFNEIFDDLLHYTFIMEAAMDANMNEDTNKESTILESINMAIDESQMCVMDAWEEMDDKLSMIQESKMSAKKRNNLKNGDFGLVYKDDNGKTIRKYPLNDKAHVASAARLFGHCPDKYKKRLARKILSKAREYGMDTSGWDTVNKAAKG